MAKQGSDLSIVELLLICLFLPFVYFFGIIVFNLP